MRNKITILTILILAISNSANLTTAATYHTNDKPVSKMKSEAASRSQKRQRISFKKGASSATVSGTVRNDLEMIYIVRARAGQTIDVKITDGGKNNDVVFYIIAPDDSFPMGADASANYDTAWRGKLRKTGDYEIYVGIIESKKANFKMSVAIR